MSPSKEIAIHLGRGQRFYFSASHFVLGENYEEGIHGHNFEVESTIRGSVGEEGMVIDFFQMTEILEELLRIWDHKTLLPGKNSDVVIEKQGIDLHLQYGDRFYKIPSEDVVILPTSNVTTEELSKLLYKKMWHKLTNIGTPHKIIGLKVTVWEYPWQGATTGPKS